MQLVIQSLLFQFYDEQTTTRTIKIGYHVDNFLSLCFFPFFLWWHPQPLPLGFALGPMTPQSTPTEF